MALNIENISGGTLAVNDLGIELGIGEIRDIALAADPQVIALSGNGGDLETLITGSSIEVKDPIDGVTNLSTADALAAIRAHNETHWRVGAGARIGDISDVDVSGASPGDVLQLGGGGTWDDVPVSSLAITTMVDADGDTRIQVEESADDDTIRWDVGETPAGYSAVTDIMTMAASGWTVAMGTADAATAGAPISITSGIGGDAASDGGDITLTAGDGGATSGTGGNITLAPGDGDTDGVVRIPNKANTNAIILDYDTDGTNSPELRQESGGGAWHLSSDAAIVQLFGGSNAAGTTDFFIDADNDGNLNLNVLHAGPVVIGEGGIQLEASGGGANEHAIIAAPTITADFTWTLPDGNPGGASLLEVSAAGVISYTTAATDAFTTVTPDSGGNVVADSATDTLTLAGGTGIDTVGTPGTDTVTFDLNASLNDLNDVNTPSPSTDNVLRWSGTEWEAVMINELLSGALPAVQVRRTATLAISTPSYADIPWDATDFENDPSVIEHNNTNTDDIDIKEDGLYLIAFNLSIDADAGEETFDVRIRLDDTTELPGSLRTISEDDEINDVSNLFVASINAGSKITMQIQASGAGNVLAVTSTMTVIKQQGAKGDQGDPGAGSTIIIEDEGVVVGGGPHDTLNFVGSGVTATDAGGGEATITISGGGSGDVSAAANLSDNSIVRGDGGVKGVQDSDDGALIDWTIADSGRMEGQVTVTEAGPPYTDAHFGFFLHNTATSGGGGLVIHAGEAEGDIALRICDEDNTLNILDVHADNGQFVFGDSYDDTLTANGVVYGIDNQHPSGTETDFNTQNGGYRIAGNLLVIDDLDDVDTTTAAPAVNNTLRWDGTNWVPGLGGGARTRFHYNADDLRSPVNSNWAVNGLAPNTPDTVNPAVNVRRFDDTVEEGVGFMHRIPTGATSMTIHFVSRRQTAGASSDVIPRLYRRQFPNNAAPTAWSAVLSLTALTFPNNLNYQYDSQTITLATLGLTAGQTTQFELTRLGTVGGDTLSGDWNLLELRIVYT